MRKVFRRLVAAFFVILMLVTLFPFQVFAVDPVSAATMANALAQALTAYGASHGVSMMFDVSNPSGIGEGLHDLWGQFKADINDNNVPTYDSLAVTLWTNLYTKVRNSVAVNVSAENVGYFDRFWNWLLSGPAEMTKVDNQYFEWNVNQNNTVSPINVYAVSVNSLNGYNMTYINRYDFNNTDYALTFFNGNSSDLLSTYWVQFQNTDGNYYICIYSDVANTNARMYYNGSPSTTYNFTFSSNAVIGYYYGYGGRSTSYPGIEMMSRSDWLSMHSSLTSASSADPESQSSNYYIRPYIGDTVPQNVPIPDTDDPDYSPLPYVGPLGVSWIDNNFGDGQSMTDAQREAIAGALDDAIEDDGTLTLEEDQTVPDNPGGEVISGPSAYTVPGLADVFPFCIPFDIYHFLQALSAEPTPPHFTATLAFPEAVGGSQQIDIDFDTPTFNQIAAILRTMELLAFCIGLALLTRSMFIRG